MNRTDIFVIEYKLHGQPKTFIIRVPIMRNAEAWHWATCDAGLAPIPKPGRPPLKVVLAHEIAMILFAEMELAGSTNLSVLVLEFDVQEWARKSQGFRRGRFGHPLHPVRCTSWPISQRPGHGSPI